MKTKPTAHGMDLFVWPGFAWAAALSFVVPVSARKKTKKKPRVRRAANIIAFPIGRVTRPSLRAVDAEVISLPKSA